MSVSKIFITLVIVVACVGIGALVLNILLPNATATVVNSVEAQIFNSTGLTFDFNGDGMGASDGADHTGGNTATDDASDVTNAGVDGIQ